MIRNWKIGEISLFDPVVMARKVVKNSIGNSYLSIASKTELPTVSIETIHYKKEKSGFKIENGRYSDLIFYVDTRIANGFDDELFFTQEMNKFIEVHAAWFFTYAERRGKVGT